MATAFSFSGCSKSNDAPSTPPVPTTALQITTTDGLGNKLAGATVTLYSSQTDWKNSTNPIVSGVTNAFGAVTFDNLTSLQYYWSASMDCENNVNGSATTTTPITTHITTSITTVLTGTGTLKFVNNSANPYSIYINGALAGTVAGNSIGQIINKPIGSYSIRVLQNSGYLISPTDETVNGTLTCGATLTITFP